MSDNRRGLLVILSSPSGAGKSTLSKMLLEWDPSMRFSVSATTRDPRPGETNGKEYFFKSQAEFDEMVAKGEMLEHASVFGNSYGSPKLPVEDAILKGVDVVFDVDWQGGEQIRASSLGADTVSIFILPPSISELERRLNVRGQDSEEVVANRMSKSADEISHWKDYDYVIVNDDLRTAFETLSSILVGERNRRERRLDLNGHVEKLNTEFESYK